MWEDQTKRQRRRRGIRSAPQDDRGHSGCVDRSTVRRQGLNDGHVDRCLKGPGRQFRADCRSVQGQKDVDRPLDVEWSGRGDTPPLSRSG